MSLRNELSKLAAEKPELRKHLLPLLKRAAEDTVSEEDWKYVQDDIRAIQSYVGNVRHYADAEDLKRTKLALDGLKGFIGGIYSTLGFKEDAKKLGVNW